MQKFQWRGTNYEAIVKAVNPKYRKRDVYLSSAESVSMYNMNWEGGSINEYYKVELVGTKYFATKIAAPSNPWRAPASQNFELKGRIVVQGGMFCGKEATLHIFVEGEPK